LSFLRYFYTQKLGFNDIGIFLGKPVAHKDGKHVFQYNEKKPNYCLLYYTGNVTQEVQTIAVYPKVCTTMEKGFKYMEFQSCNFEFSN